MQLLANALIAGSLAALIAGGLSLVYGTLGVFNLALGQMVLIGGYTTWWLHIQVGAPLLVSVFFGIGCGVLLAWAAFELCIAPFYQRHRFLPLVTTIALSMVLDGVIVLLFGSAPKGIKPGLKSTVEVFGAVISWEQIVLIVLSLLVLSLFAYVLHSTSLGRRIRAVVQHPQAAMSLGVKSFALHRMIFVFSGVLASCGGIFVGIDQNLSPVLAFPITIKAYAAIIAGGKGHFWGAILCAYSIALLEQLVVGVPWFAGGYIPAGYQQTVALILIIIFLLVRPLGLFASHSRTA